MLPNAGTLAVAQVPGVAPALRPAPGAAPAPAPLALPRHRAFTPAQGAFSHAQGVFSHAQAGLRSSAARPLMASDERSAVPSWPELLLKQHLSNMGLTPRSGGSEPPSEFHVNFGRAVRTLREDIPRYYPLMRLVCLWCVACITSAAQSAFSARHASRLPSEQPEDGRALPLHCRQHALTQAPVRRFFTQAPNTSVLAEDNFVFVDRIGRVHLGGGTTVVCGIEAYRRHLFMLRMYCGLIFSRSSVRLLPLQASQSAFRRVCRLCSLWRAVRAESLALRLYHALII